MRFGVATIGAALTVLSACIPDGAKDERHLNVVTYDDPVKTLVSAVTAACWPKGAALDQAEAALIEAGWVEIENTFNPDISMQIYKAPGATRTVIQISKPNASALGQISLMCFGFVYGGSMDALVSEMEAVLGAEYRRLGSGNSRSFNISSSKYLSAVRTGYDFGLSEMDRQGVAEGLLVNLGVFE